MSLSGLSACCSHRGRGGHPPAPGLASTTSLLSSPVMKCTGDSLAQDPHLASVPGRSPQMLTHRTERQKSKSLGTERCQQLQTLVARTGQWGLSEGNILVLSVAPWLGKKSPQVPDGTICPTHPWSLFPTSTKTAPITLISSYLFTLASAIGKLKELRCNTLNTATHKALRCAANHPLEK
jgi:hypothetical protein